MTPPQPPRLPLWLLERFAPDNEPLVGDLIEQFQSSGSRSWFWRQALAAIALERFNRSREVRPLRLVERDDLPPAPSVERRAINLTASPIPGIGGLGLVLFAALVSLVAPELWWIVLLVYLDGALLGVAWIFLNRPRGDARGSVLFGGSGDRPDTGCQPKGRA
jgi:hypothetical protein